MSLTKKQVEHIAQLAKLELSKKEKEKFTFELSSILDYFEKLKEVKTEKVEPCSHAIGIDNVMRDDRIKISKSKIQNPKYYKTKAIL